jgi:hypothetical protein
MANTLVINSITGTSPFDIYVCDATINYCFFVDTISSLPYTFDIPFPLEDTTPIILKVVDANDCERIYLLNCQEIYGKEFENFPIFLFQDASIFLFQGPV